MFGDGTTSMREPKHAYAAAGTYGVTLTVTDNAGASATTKEPATPTAPINVAPSANFTVEVLTQQLHLHRQVQRQRRGHPETGSELGNGTTSSAQNPTHVYAKGTYYPEAHGYRQRQSQPERGRVKEPAGALRVWS